MCVSSTDTEIVLYEGTDSIYNTIHYNTVLHNLARQLICLGQMSSS